MLAPLGRPAAKMLAFGVLQDTVTVVCKCGASVLGSTDSNSGVWLAAYLQTRFEHNTALLCSAGICLAGTTDSWSLAQSKAQQRDTNRHRAACLKGVLLLTAAEPLIAAPVLALRLSTRSDTLAVADRPLLTVVQLMEVPVAALTLQGSVPIATAGTLPCAAAGSAGTKP